MAKILIIGAGPAGLTAAYELLKQTKDMEVIILEESDVVGGISRTVRFEGNRMDIGGHRFFSKDRHVMDWWAELMPLQGAPSKDDLLLNRESSLKEDGPDPENEDKVMLVRKRVSRIYYKTKFFDYPISFKWKLFRNMGLWSTIKAGTSYLYSTVIKKKEDCLENFYCNRFGKVLYTMFFEGYTEKLWGRHPREISADWGAQRVKGLSIAAIFKDIFSKMIPGKKKREVETSLIEEFWYPKYGPGQLWETVAEEIQKMGCQICFGSNVTKVHKENGKIVAVTYEKNGEEIREEADILISSMPIKDLIGGMEDVSTDVQAVAQNLPYRDFVTVGIQVPKLHLKNDTAIKTWNDLVPDCWIYVQDTAVKLGRIQIFNNWSPYMVQDAENTVFVGLEYFCNEGDAFWNMSEEECNAFVIKELISMGILKDEAEVQKSHRERVKKAYPAYFDSYDEIDTVIKYLNTFENLYCIGRNGQHRYNNMDHSMVTAFEAVKNIVNNETSKDNIWNVNIEKEYHEERK